MPADVTAWPSPQSWFVPLRGGMTHDSDRGIANVRRSQPLSGDRKKVDSSSLTNAAARRINRSLRGAAAALSVTASIRPARPSGQLRCTRVSLSQDHSYPLCYQQHAPACGWALRERCVSDRITVACGRQCGGVRAQGRGNP